MYFFGNTDIDIVLDEKDEEEEEDTFQEPTQMNFQRRVPLNRADLQQSCSGLLLAFCGPGGGGAMQYEMDIAVRLALLN